MRPQHTLVLILLLAFNHVQSQNTDSLSKKLAGKWLLTKHVIVDSSSTIEHVDTNLTCTFEFFENGTCCVTYSDKRYGQTVNNGKWKFSNDGTKVLLFDIVDVPDDPLVFISDHDMPVVSLTTTQFVINEYLFSESKMGASYYIRQ